jgi:hypothetical protein
MWISNWSFYSLHYFYTVTPYYYSKKIVDSTGMNCMCNSVFHFLYSLCTIVMRFYCHCCNSKCHRGQTAVPSDEDIQATGHQRRRPQVANILLHDLSQHIYIYMYIYMYIYIASWYIFYFSQNSLHTATQQNFEYTQPLSFRIRLRRCIHHSINFHGILDSRRCSGPNIQASTRNKAALVNFDNNSTCRALWFKCRDVDGENPST